jgi:FkbM family methyltransferase
MRRVNTTFRRRLLRLLHRLGGSVVDLGPGVAVVTRKEGVRARDLGKGAYLVLARSGSHRSARMAHGLFLVGPAALFGREKAKRDKAVSDWLALEHLRDVLERYRVDVVMDVGANKGQYAKSLRKIGYRGLILSFEPVPEVFAELSLAAAADELWHVHQIALGREHGELEMNVVPGTLSSLLPPSEFGAARYAKLRDVSVQSVPVRRIDELLDGILPAGTTSPRILLKLDTQGFDLEAYAGLGDKAEHVVALQSEVALMTIYDRMPRMPEALAVYEAGGFEITGMYPVSREARTGRVLEYDCVMVRAKAL